MEEEQEEGQEEEGEVDIRTGFPGEAVALIAPRPIPVTLTFLWLRTQNLAPRRRCLRQEKGASSVTL